MPRRVEIRQHTWVSSAIAKVLLALADLVVFIRNNLFPGINTPRTAYTSWQYPEDNTGDHNVQPEGLKA